MNYLKLGTLFLAAVVFIGLFPFTAQGENEDPLNWSGYMDITSDFTVDEGETLIIQPGTEVVFSTYDWTIYVYGTVQALGTEEEPIIFRAEHDIPNAWKGFYLLAPGSTFQWCDFSHGWYSIRAFEGGQTIEYCNFSSGANGIILNGDGSTVHGSTFQEMTYLGVSIWGNNNTVSSCLMRDCYDGGVFLKENTGNVIKDCEINPYPSARQLNGIRMVGAYNNTITNCSFYNSDNGLNLEGDCDDNLVSDCNFVNNKYGVIMILPPHVHDDDVDESHEPAHGDDGDHTAQRNVLAYNTILECSRGIMLMGWDNVLVGNQVEGSTLVGLCFAGEDTGGNRIYLNNFFNNTENCLDPSNENIYHNIRQEGNYWSSNTGKDSDVNGITDEPYSFDLYPLAQPLEFIDGRLEDFDTDKDGILDYRDPDDDGDGYLDTEELENGWDPKDPNSPGDDGLFTIGLVLFLALLIIFAIVMYLLYRKNSVNKEN